MKRGERIFVLVEYDLFGNDLKDEEGIYISTDKHTGKYLVNFPQFGGWAELEPENIKRYRANFVPVKNRKLVERMETMKITFVC